MATVSISQDVKQVKKMVEVTDEIVDTKVVLELSLEEAGLVKYALEKASYYDTIHPQADSVSRARMGKIYNKLGKDILWTMDGLTFIPNTGPSGKVCVGGKLRDSSNRYDNTNLQYKGEYR